jgi:hypothetical protein
MNGFNLEETSKICAVNPCCQIKEPAVVAVTQFAPAQRRIACLTHIGMNSSK